MLLLWAIRFFVFKLYESPKYLMGRGRDDQAVQVVHKVAAYNGKMSRLTLDQLRSAGSILGQEKLDASAKAAIGRRMMKFNSNHVKVLFATRRLAYSTSLLILLWGTCCLDFSMTCMLS